MGLFSRRKKSDPVPEEGIEAGEQPVQPAGDAHAAGAAGTSAEDSADAAEPDEPGNPDEPDDPEPEGAGSPAVGISVSSFNGLGGAPAASGSAASPAPAPAAAAPASAPAFRRGPAEAPAPTGSIAGLRDNVLLRDALAALRPSPEAAQLVNVARQLLQGHVFLRVRGDARALLAAGEPLPLAVAERAGKQYVLAYSSGAALQASVRADGDTATSAMGQPVLAVLAHVLAGSHEGLVIDNSSAPARAVLPRPILERAVAEADPQLRVKTLLAAPRTDATAGELVEAMIAAPLWVAVKRADDGALVGVAESRTAQGERYLEVFSHPLEALVLGRGDQAVPVTTAQLATALARDSGLAGVSVDPAGPWMRVVRADLAPLLAHAEP